MRKPYSFLYYKIMGHKGITNSWLKKAALRELREMSTSPEYANQVHFVKNAKSLLYAFRWINTELGFKFWKRVNLLLELN